MKSGRSAQAPISEAFEGQSGRRGAVTRAERRAAPSRPASPRGIGQRIRWPRGSHLGEEVNASEGAAGNAAAGLFHALIDGLVGCRVGIHAGIAAA